MPHRFVEGKWLVLVFIATIAWTVLSYYVFSAWGIGGLIIAAAVPFFAFTYLVFEILLRLVNEKKSREVDYEQVQALVALYSTLKLEMPLFNLRRFALCPDSAALYMYLVKTYKPKTILELGSGMSTVISGKILERYEGGRVIAIDNDAHWTEQTKEILATHDIKTNVEVRHAPLEPVEVDGVTRNWYSLRAFEDLENIDMLLVDGPIDSSDTGNRTPALHLLKDKLSPNTVVICDDTFRLKWKQFVKDWAKENDFDYDEPYPNERQTVVLRRNI